VNFVKWGCGLVESFVEKAGLFWYDFSFCLVIQAGNQDIQQLNEVLEIFYILYKL
jgi:hypothetical protein